MSRPSNNERQTSCHCHPYTQYPERVFFSSANFPPFLLRLRNHLISLSSFESAASGQTCRHTRKIPGPGYGQSPDLYSTNGVGTPESYPSMTFTCAFSFLSIIAPPHVQTSIVDSDINQAYNWPNYRKMHGIFLAKLANNANPVLARGATQQLVIRQGLYLGGSYGE